ncbi:MAG: sugar phosphate isomerase [Planctomycetes bacterium SCN 63-9]|nr:MAG: sugar phosphate isomerase [Planctomycetes bacterium SCN 63-9]
MQSKSDRDLLSRRDLLVAGLIAAGSFGIGERGLSRVLADEPKSDPYGPFKIGLQSYSLRGFKAGGKSDRTKALELTKKLGLHYWEAYPEHIPFTLDAKGIEAVKQQLKAADVTVAGYGVVPLTKDAGANRKYFEFAKAMNLDYLSADPALDSFDTLDKQVEEYGVAIGIHNHGPGHHYALIDTIAKAIKDHNPKIGCCIDTGHFLRSKEDPVRAAEVFAGRTYGVHLKDVKDAVKFTILGEGDLRVADLLKTLHAKNYKSIIAIEYEEKPENPMEDVEACLKYARSVIADIHKSGTTKGKKKGRSNTED